MRSLPESHAPYPSINESFTVMGRHGCSSSISISPCAIVFTIASLCGSLPKPLHRTRRMPLPLARLSASMSTSSFLT